MPANGRRHSACSCGDVVLDIDERMLYVDGARTELSFAEFEVLHRLMRDPGRVLSREELQAPLPYDGDRSPRAVDVRIARLRRKLSGARRFAIETVRYVGYRCAPVELHTEHGAPHREFVRATY
jgi:DNA-binding response OmpR family regulator